MCCCKYFKVRLIIVFPLLCTRRRPSVEKEDSLDVCSEKHLLVLLSDKFKSKVLRKHSKIVEEECSSRKIQRKMSMKSVRGFRDQVDESDSHSNDNDDDEAYVPPELVTFEEFENLYPRFVKLKDIHLTEQEGELYVVFFVTPSLSLLHINTSPRKQVLGSDSLHEHSTHSATLRFTYKSL